MITSDFVTIDLAGFTISGSGVSALTAGIRARASTPDGLLQGLAVRNGSISRFGAGVDLSGDGSIVEGLRVFGGLPNAVGISATGIVKGNTVVEIAGFLGVGTGISATGVVTGNYAFGNGTGFDIGQGSTVIGNTTTDNVRAGLVVSCPSNVTDNTATGTRELGNLVLNGEGCNNTNNVAP